MKIKTSEAVGVTLDYLVAKAQGREEIRIFGRTCPNDRGWIEVRFNPEPRADTARFDPSSNWAQGGPIIDLAGIQWAQVGGEMEAWFGFDYLEWRRNWELPPQLQQGAGFGTGPTLLIAAMRCYCCAKLGEYVDIPEELLK